MISREQKAAKCQNGPCNASEFCDFQAEYEGSISFTRSSLFKHFGHSRFLVLTRCCRAFLTFDPSFFERRSASWCRL